MPLEEFKDPTALIDSLDLHSYQLFLSLKNSLRKDDTGGNKKINIDNITLVKFGKHIGQLNKSKLAERGAYSHIRPVIFTIKNNPIEKRNLYKQAMLIKAYQLRYKHETKEDLYESFAKGQKIFFDYYIEQYRKYLGKDITFDDVRLLHTKKRSGAEAFYFLEPNIPFDNLYNFWCNRLHLDENYDKNRNYYKTLNRFHLRQQIAVCIAVIKEFNKFRNFYHDDTFIVHNDLKPANFLYDPFHNRAFLIDLDYAKKLPKDIKLTETTPLIGTTDYIAPEIYQGNINCRSDFPALSKIIAELLGATPELLELVPIINEAKEKKIHLAHYKINLSYLDEWLTIKEITELEKFLNEMQDINPEKRPEDLSPLLQLLTKIMQRILQDELYLEHGYSKKSAMAKAEKIILAGCEHLPLKEELLQSYISLCDKPSLTALRLYYMSSAKNMLQFISDRADEEAKSNCRKAASSILFEKYKLYPRRTLSIYS